MGVEKQLPKIRQMGGEVYGQLNNIPFDRAAYCRNWTRHLGGGYGTRFGIEPVAGTDTYMVMTYKDKLIAVCADGLCELAEATLSSEFATSPYKNLRVRVSTVLGVSSYVRNVLITDIDTPSTELDQDISATAYTIADLISALDAASNLSSTAVSPASADTATDANFLFSHDSTVLVLNGEDALVGGRLAFKYKIDQTGPRGTLSFTPYEAIDHVASGRFWCPQFVEIADSLFFIHAEDSVANSPAIWKYDGEAVYLPGAITVSGVTPTPSVATASGTLSGSYKYKIRYKYIDNQDRIIYSDPSAASAVVSPSTQSVNVTVSNHTATSTRSRGGMFAGAQTTQNTLNVDDGAGGAHSLVAGQVAYLIDAVSGGYITRNITAVTSSTVTIDGAAVTVPDNLPISNNVRIQIFRTEDSGDIFYLLDEIPNNPYASTYVYGDDAADSTLGEELFEPLSGFELNNGPNDTISDEAGNEFVAPFAALAVYENRLFAGGGHFIRWSQFGKPEHMHQLDNYEIPPTREGDEIVAMRASSGGLLVFKKFSTWLVNGDFNTGDLSQRKIDNIGCIANNSVDEADNDTLIMLTHLGILRFDTRSLSFSQVCDANSKIIDDIVTYFSDDPVGATHWPSARGVYDDKRNRYHLSVPSVRVLPPFGETAYYLTGSFGGNAIDPRYYEIDLETAQLYPYSGNWLFGTGPIVKFEDTFYWSSTPSVSSAVGSAKFYVARFIPEYSSRQARAGQLSNSPYDYRTTYRYRFGDHIDPIDARWQGGWWDGGEPSLPKKINRAKIYALDSRQNISQDVLVEIYGNWEQGDGVVALSSDELNLTTTVRFESFALLGLNEVSYSVRVRKEIEGEVTDFYAPVLLSLVELEVAASSLAAIKAKR